MSKRSMVLLSATLLLLISALWPPRQARATTPFLGEIRWVSFNFAPKGWQLCNGQLLPINQNQALFSLLGTTFGGDGRINFALPDMRSRAPIHVSPSYPLGGVGGEESHTLTLSELPSHSHLLSADPKEGTAVTPSGNYPAKTGNGSPAYASTPSASMAADSTTSVGNGLPHENMKPYITMNCIISLQGIFPSQN